MQVDQVQAYLGKHLDVFRAKLNKSHVEAGLTPTNAGKFSGVTPLWARAYVFDPVWGCRVYVWHEAQGVGIKECSGHIELP